MDVLTQGNVRPHSCWTTSLTRPIATISWIGRGHTLVWEVYRLYTGSRPILLGILTYMSRFRESDCRYALLTYMDAKWNFGIDAAERKTSMARNWAVGESVRRRSFSLSLLRWETNRHFQPSLLDEPSCLIWKKQCELMVSDIGGKIRMSISWNASLRSYLSLWDCIDLLIIHFGWNCNRFSETLWLTITSVNCVEALVPWNKRFYDNYTNR